jgi:hypothetical protein
MFLRNVCIYLHVHIISPSSALKVETVCFFETFVSTYNSTPIHKPEDQRWQSSFCLTVVVCVFVVLLSLVTCLSEIPRATRPDLEAKR